MSNQALKESLANEYAKVFEQLLATHERLWTTYTSTLDSFQSCKDERDQLKAQCEKLAQALDDILMAVPSLSEVLKIARENLAEYREKFKK